MSGRKKDNIISGTKSGGKKAAATNKLKYGDDFYVNIGREGGKKGRTGGFAAIIPCENNDCPYVSKKKEHLIRNCAGSVGGKRSTRQKATQ